MQQGTDGTKVHFALEFLLHLTLSLPSPPLSLTRIVYWDKLRTFQRQMKPICAPLISCIILLYSCKLQPTNCKVPSCCFCYDGFCWIWFLMPFHISYMHFIFQCKKMKNSSDSVSHFYWYRPLWQVHRPCHAMHHAYMHFNAYFTFALVHSVWVNPYHSNSNNNHNREWPVHRIGKQTERKRSACTVHHAFI